MQQLQNAQLQSIQLYARSLSDIAKLADLWQCLHIKGVCTPHMGLPRGHSGKKSACQCRLGFSASARELGSIHGLGRAPRRGNTHCSIFAWRILWTEEPGGLQSMGSQRVRHDWAQAHVPPQPSAMLGADIYNLLLHYFLLNQSMVWSPVCTILKAATVS